MTFLLISFIVVLYHIIPLHGAEVYIHMMPWFETKATNNGTWGIHWTMANRNPDNVTNGKQDIASFYHPQIGAYASSDPDVIDWQLGVIKVAGAAGIFLDWPGTTPAFDYPKNKQNVEAIIEGTKRAGLKFAIVYEDNNLNIASVPDKVKQGQADMRYLQDNYFTKDNYVKIRNAPLLLDFGPQALHDDEWDKVLGPLDPKPVFVPLWNQSYQGGKYVQGEFAWVAAEHVEALKVWYANQKVSLKIGVAYPGFQGFYKKGGWGGPKFSIEHGVSTFNTTWGMAWNNTDIVQVCTWNNYGEGTAIEPTLEYGTKFVDIIQGATGTKYTHEDFEDLTEIYFLKKKHADNVVVLEQVKQWHRAVVHKFD